MGRVEAPPGFQKPCQGLTVGRLGVLGDEGCLEAAFLVVCVEGRHRCPSWCCVTVNRDRSPFLLVACSLSVNVKIKGRGCQEENEERTKNAGNGLDACCGAAIFAVEVENSAWLLAGYLTMSLLGTVGTRSRRRRAGPGAT